MRKLSIFVGNWELETNDNLEEFLKFYEYNWFVLKPLFWQVCMLILVNQYLRIH